MGVSFVGFTKKGSFLLNLWKQLWKIWGSNWGFKKSSLMLDQIYEF
jgi:hypothetical protein